MDGWMDVDGWMMSCFSKEPHIGRRALQKTDKFILVAPRSTKDRPPPTASKYLLTVHPSKPQGPFFLPLHSTICDTKFSS